MFVVKFRQKIIFSSLRPVFVISSVFRQKRNPLEPNHNLFSFHVFLSKLPIISRRL